MKSKQLYPRKAETNPSEAALVRLKVSELFLPGQQKLHLLHGGETYVLQITQNNKLILTK